MWGTLSRNRNTARIEHMGTTVHKASREFDSSTLKKGICKHFTDIFLHVAEDKVVLNLNISMYVSVLQILSAGVHQNCKQRLIPLIFHQFPMTLLCYCCRPMDPFCSQLLYSCTICRSQKSVRLH